MASLKKNHQLNLTARKGQNQPGMEIGSKKAAAPIFRNFNIKHVDEPIKIDIA